MDYQSMFRAQQAFFHSQQTKDIRFRKKQLRRLKKLLQAHEQELYDAIYLDFAKSPFETYATELAQIYKEIDFFLKNLSKLSKPRPISTNLLNMPGRSRIYSEPLGCSLVIGAWNYPYHLSLAPAVAALAAGNTCIIKPSELPAHTMEVMARLINNHFPAAYLRVVPGGVVETTELLRLPFDKIFFTGSPRVGRIVYEAAAKNLTPVTLELGGKSPAIVSRHAGLDVAARRIVWGKFLNAGQTCIAPDYLLVHASVKEALLQRMEARLEEARYESGAGHYVRIINQQHFERLSSLIHPDQVRYGGGSDRQSLYIQPTILDPVSWDDALMQEEIFGPLLPVLTFEDLETALDQVVRLEKPLAAYLFTVKDAEKACFTSRLSFGGGCINDVLMHISNEHLPFGGVGQSGTGHYHGIWGFEAFSHQKPVLERAGWGEPPLKYPPYTKRKIKWMKKLL